MLQVSLVRDQDGSAGIGFQKSADKSSVVISSLLSGVTRTQARFRLPWSACSVTRTRAARCADQGPGTGLLFMGDTLVSIDQKPVTSMSSDEVCVSRPLR